MGKHSTRIQPVAPTDSPAPPLAAKPKPAVSPPAASSPFRQTVPNTALHVDQPPSVRLEEKLEEKARKPSPSPAPATDPSASFETTYLRLVTREFGADIDKVRQAGDWTDAKLPILVEALRQGVGIYGDGGK